MGPPVAGVGGMIWRASDRSFSWKPNGTDLELEGSVLTVRQRGTSIQIDIASPSVEMTMHHFAVSRGSILRLRSGTTEVTVAGEAYAATDSPYADEVLKDARVFLGKTAFEHFHQALRVAREAARPASASNEGGRRRSFMLWGNTNTLRPALGFMVAVLVTIVLFCAAKKLCPSIIAHHSDVLMAICQVGFVGGIAYQWWWMHQSSKPALLVVEGETFTLSQLKPRSTLRSWTRSEAEIRLTRWRTPSSRVASTQVLPVVEIRIHGELVVSAALQAQKLSPEASRGRTPRYNVDWLWSSAFLDCVVSAADKKGLSIEPVRAW